MGFKWHFLECIEEAECKRNKKVITNVLTLNKVSAGGGFFLNIFFFLQQHSRPVVSKEKNYHV